jgi:hypothetical protein
MRLVDTKERAIECLLEVSLPIARVDKRRIVSLSLRVVKAENPFAQLPPTGVCLPSTRAQIFAQNTSLHAGIQARTEVWQQDGDILCASVRVGNR